MDRPFWGHKDMLLSGLYLGVALLNSPSNTLSALVHTLPDYRRSNSSKGVFVHPIHFTDETRERTCARPGPHSSQAPEPSLDLGSPHSVPRPLPTWRGCSAHHSDNLTSGPLPHLPASPRQDAGSISFLKALGSALWEKQKGEESERKPNIGKEVCFQ